MRWLMLCALLLAGCDDSPPSPKARAERVAKRMQAADVVLQKTPAVRTYRYSDGELRVMNVLVADESGYLDTQRCLLWRDHEFKQSSFSCSPPHDFGKPPPAEMPGPRD